jgi:DNA polymerase III delta subunit
MRSAVEAVRDAIFGEGQPGHGLEAFNTERFDAPFVRSSREVLTACAQLPVMASRRLVELSAPEAFGKQVASSRDEEPAAMMEALIEYLQQPSEQTVLLITSTGINGTSKLVKAAVKASKSSTGGDAPGTVVVRKLAAPSERDAGDILRRDAEARGVRLRPDAARLLVEMLGNDPAALSSALARAIDHAGSKTVTTADVEAVAVAGRKDGDIFAFTDAVGHRDLPGALRLLSRMFPDKEDDTGEAMRVFAMLVWHMRRLCVARFADDPVGALNVKPFAARKLAEQAERWDEAELRRAHAHLSRLDDDYKGGSKLAYHAPYLVLQRWLLESLRPAAGIAPRTG